MTFRAIAIVPLVLAACRFQDLTPGASRHDEVGIQAVVTSFYRAVATRDAAALQHAALGSATVLLATERSAPVLVPLRTLIEIPERRNQGGGVRITRTEPRIDGDLASERVVVVARSSDGRHEHEYEATDVLSLARRGGEWRVGHALLGTWHLRSAP